MNLEAEEQKEVRESTAWSYHRQPQGKEEWLTPKEIVDALGPFDLDPCAPINPPWRTAVNTFTTEDNGLLKDWSHYGRIWCNPPYTTAATWLARCAAHNNTIALVFARTETKMFFDHVWPKAKGVAFFRGRITFLNVDGSKPKFTGGAPSCLIAWGHDSVNAIKGAIALGKLDAKFIHL